jgi:hypothetical protein
MQPWAVISTIVGIIALMVTIFIQTNSSIDRKIDAKLKDPEFIQMIVREARLPSLIFDNHGSVLLDQGAMRFIEAIDVELSKGDVYPKVYPVQIIIHPKQHLPFAPLLTTLDVDLANISSARGKKYDWIYTIEYISTNSDRKTLRYRLELIL